MSDVSSPSTPEQRNYAMRRVIYNTLVAAKSLDFIPRSKDDYSAKEMAKVSGLIMARNLDDFFFKLDREAAKPTKRSCNSKPRKSNSKPDDIFIHAFTIPWHPPKNAMITEGDYKRINKLVGHIVAAPPKPFEDGEAIAVIEKLVRTAIDFIKSCVTTGQASYTGNSGFYLRRLNGTLEKIGISQLPNA